ncbi:restriction endonuclease [Alicyclobacillus dauci]|uniref:restriction endonuclease n=1 Tax=Alicyclobacillus dauci TaxID=1475485 RepID=UPI00389901C2
MITIPHNLLVIVGVLLGIAIVLKAVTSSQPKKRKRGGTGKRKASSNKKRSTSNPRTSSTTRSDEVILSTPVSKLTWSEFERLFALYFRDYGYTVEEPGVGGNDGGVDLVITEKRTGERTAVQLKHWNDSRKVGPNIVRELHSARLNTKPTCVFAMLITSSDLTQQARTEADERRIKFWHGSVVQMKLNEWDKWKGKRIKTRVPR